MTRYEAAELILFLKKDIRKYKESIQASYDQIAQLEKEHDIAGLSKYGIIINHRFINKALQIGRSG